MTDQNPFPVDASPSSQPILPEPRPGVLERFNHWLRNSVTVRIIVIGILILLLLIPLDMVKRLIAEREGRQMEAISEVGSKWGREQTLIGPVLSIPYNRYTKVVSERDGEKVEKLVKDRVFAHFLPDQLDIEGQVDPETRYRGMYEVIVYRADFSIKGRFSTPDFSDWGIDEEEILWEEAFLSVGISDLRSIEENVSVAWAGVSHTFDPGIESDDLIHSGISTRIPLGPWGDLDSIGEEGQEFQMQLRLKGSSSLNFIPVGKTTRVDLNSGWPDPKFDGAFLPEREIGDDGFNARWQVLHLNRPYPQQFLGRPGGLQESRFGVDLIMPVDQYQKSYRSAKYAVMIISLTFLVFFFVQVMNRVGIHPIQYILVGLALCVFYILLLSISEQLGFGPAYLISGLATIGLVTFYVGGVFRTARLTMIMGGVLTILYGFLFVTIQNDDYALLLGSIGLFVALAVVMALSRKIDWYNRSEK